MNTRRKLMIAAAAIGLPVVAWAASVEFRDFSDAGASIHVSGQMPGTVARLERSTDLVNWAPVDAESVAPDGTALLSYVNAPGQPRGFYRVAAEPAPRSGSVVQIQCSQDQGERPLLGNGYLGPDFGPYASEGSAYPQLYTSITPTRAGNKLMVEADITVQTGSGSGGNLLLALFQDDLPQALAVAGEILQPTTLGSNSGSMSHQVRLRYFLTAAATVPTTFKIRLSDDQSGTPTANRFARLGNYGNKIVSTMTVTEIQQ